MNSHRRGNTFDIPLAMSSFFLRPPAQVVLHMASAAVTFVLWSVWVFVKPLGQSRVSLLLNEGRRRLAHDIIVRGGSTGALITLKQIFADLPADLPAAVFVVRHIPSDAGICWLIFWMPLDL